MIDTFNFPARINPVGEVTLRVRETQFGDGYTQRSGDGINGESDSWPLTFVGDWDYISPIRNFIRSHKGYIAFQWRNPLFELGLYICKTHQVTALGNNSRGKPMYQLTATFETAFHP
ncbi:phage tail protein [Sodalis sp. RH20]|uniref:phage tail protein n=1 Tax=unclassified Sodalis (in: enterobacteria) TaxID=2636512 RepID=UPI0039B6DE9B